MAHEVGHCFGLAHANFWDTAGTSAIGAGTNAEYGDIFDVMGGTGIPRGHFNAQGKNQIRWLPSNYVQNINQSGLYRLYAFDQPTLDPALRYALTIVKDSQRTYWGELRTLFDSINPWAANGMILGWRYPNGGPGSAGSNIQLLDTTPGSALGKTDSPISLGRTFSDTEADLHITCVAVNNDTTPRSVDMRVNFGPFPDNHSPTLALSADAIVIPTGATVTFTATASDPDGDPLAYSWQHLGSNQVQIVSPNSPVITRTFGSAGTFVVSCTVSDMKGGSTLRSQLITVGNGGGTSTISGRVTAHGVGLANVTVTASYGVAVTDTDGYYTISNLFTNTFTVTPLLYGYTFSELFNNSITVGPSFNGANFEAEETPRVSLTAPVATSNELAPVTPGTFRITRTGEISGPLTVNVNTALGTATKGNDYTFTPDYVAGSQGFSTFTIPADESFLDIIVTPVTDTSVEGAETVTLQVGSGNGYVLSNNSSATISILDDESALPKVSVSAQIAATIENSGQSIPVTFSRTGPTDSSLAVNYAIGGTATNSSDYSTLSGTVTIPAGAVSAVVNVAPLDDSLSEPLETVKLTVTTNAAYLVEPSRNTLQVNLIDNDVQILNVTATDPSATEVDLSAPGAVADTGTFIVTRSGDITNPLAVYYSVTGLTTGTAAMHGVDYEALPGVLEIPAGASSAAVTILPRYDTLGEGPESVVFELGAGPTNYRLGPNSVANVTINDMGTNPPLVDVIQMTSAVEPSTNGLFRFTARGTGTGTVTVKYSVSGTAVAGTDYTIADFDNATLTGFTTITLNNGTAVNKDLAVTVINDSAIEAIETLTLTIIDDPAYQTYEPSSSARMCVYDNEQPTVFVDAQVGTNDGNNSPPTVSENGTGAKFYLSRTGSTAAALTVNYTLGGTATSGADYTALSGTAVIPAGSAGLLIPLTLTDDTISEGNETLVFSLAAGGYARGSDATLAITDTEPLLTTLVGFPTPNAGSGSETLASPVIPVNLSGTAAAAPVSVEYYVDSGSRSTTTSTGPTHLLPYWVRVVRTGNDFANFESMDGINWSQRGTSNTVTMGSTNYLAGLAVTSGQSGTPLTATLDNVSVTGLSAGGTVGTAISADIGSPSPAGSDSVNGGVYTVTAGSGTNGLGANSSDGFRFVYFPISNSPNCTITARVLSESASTTNPRAGVMFRDSTLNNVRYAASLASRSGTPVQNNFLQNWRTGTSFASSNSFTTPLELPWIRLQRTGDVFTAFSSPDGQTWNPLGTPQTLPIGAPVLAGLAVSANSDGLLNTATFDNVSLTGNPLLEGRTIGFVNEQGSNSFSNGVWTVTGSGSQIGSSGDECHFVGAPVTGDFTLTARQLSQSGGDSDSQAGIMVREGTSRFARMIYNGFAANNNNSLQLLWRDSTITSASGSGVDYQLPTGVLTFAPGETTKTIPLSILNDALNEDNETITIKLRNPAGASLAPSLSLYTYLIQDDDSLTGNVYAGFAATTASALESSGSALIQVALSAPAPTAISANYAVTGGTATSSDYTLASGTVHFSAGQSVATIPVTLFNDSIIESPETVVVNLSNPVGAILGSLKTHTLTINDDDTPTVTIAANDPDAAESGGNGQFTVSRTGSTTAPLTVLLSQTGTAASGNDFTALPASVTIAAGQASAPINVTPAQDSLNEGSETVIVTLGSDAAYTLGTPNSATVTISDDDRSTVSIVANDPTATETAGNPGQLTITRTAPTTGTLAVTLTMTGTATNTTDYANLSTTFNFAANESSKTINVTPVDDGLTEGPEVVTVQIATGSTYDIGTNGYASVTLADNDSPPTLFIDRPTLQGTLIATGNGLIVSASVSDDGYPQAVSQNWSQVSGPGTATFAAPTSTTTAVTFSADGVYVLKVTATDAQFTVSDQVTVVVGSGITPSEWIAQDMGPSVSQRGQSAAKNGIYTLTGMGAGYASTQSDAAHVMIRPVSGDTAVVTRLLSVSGPATAPLAGITIRNNLARDSRRTVLGYVTGGSLQFRTRTSSTTNDTVVTQAGVTLPVWLKLDRNSTTGDITASYAPDVSGAPGTWTTIGAPVNVPIDRKADMGLTVTSNHATNLSSASFDHLTPVPTGPALITEDFGTGTPTPSTFAENNGTYTIAASGGMDGSGAFYGQQYYGDLMVTAKLANATSGALSAKSGLMIRESMDNGSAYTFLGRVPISSSSGYLWRPFANGSGSMGAVSSFTDKVRWMRLIRQGNAITAFHAADVAGAPGPWTQLGQPRTVTMSTPVLVGFAVDNGGSNLLNTATFSNLSIVPLNKAPVVNPGTITSSVVASTQLAGSVTDDDFPSPPSLDTHWTSIGGPVTATFGDASSPDTVASFTADGAYTLRLSASDGSVETFADLPLFAYASAFSKWQGDHFNGGSNNPVAAPARDPDSDGLSNFLEYCLNTNPSVATPNPIVRETATVGADKFLRLKISRNTKVPGVTYEVQATSDLTNPGSWSSVGLIPEADTETLLQVRDNVPMSSSRSRFMRIKVSQ